MTLSDITPQMMIEAYRQGIFPMAEDAADEHFNFYHPYLRGQLSISDIHIPKRLWRTLKQNPYTIAIDQNFQGVIDGCAKTSSDKRDNTWINAQIRDVFIALHKEGYAHSVECYQDGELIGGLYGLAIGAVFCGESMFSTADDASKIALIHLCARLHKGGFTVLDTQFKNDHLEQFGIYEIPQENYEALIKTEMDKKSDFILEGISEEQMIGEYIGFRKHLAPEHL